MTPVFSGGFFGALRRLMIQNGTLREDGTVNRETARRLGWSLAGEDLRAEKKAEETARD